MYESGSGDGQRSGWRKRTISDMAREAQLPYFYQTGETANLPQLERFAELVREDATTEANAKSNASWAMMCEKMVANEREACAKVCDVLAVHPEYASEVTKLAALAIRARGQA